MISIDLIYQQTRQILQKELGTGYLDPAQFNAFANMSNVELFNKYAGVYQNTQQVTDKILPFIKKSVIAIDSANGQMLHPSDYVDRVAVRAFEPDALLAAQKASTDTDPINYFKIPQIDVDTIDNDKLGGRLISLVVPPTKYLPIITFYDNYIQWHPIDTGVGIFEYLRQPVDVVWGYTVGADGLEVYDPTTSVNFEWLWKMRNELIIKICSYFGVSVRAEDLIQYSGLMQQQQA